MKNSVSKSEQNPDVKGVNGYLLEVKNLKTYFRVKRGLLTQAADYTKAVDDVSFRIKTGQTLGLVGESGCGKTTIAKTIIRLVPATAGTVLFDGTNVLSAGRKQLRQLRSDISLVFQDHFGSLNPRMTIADIIGEPLEFHSKVSGNQLIEHIRRLLSKVGLSEDCLNRYPHEFSGGQRQRIGIARALSLEPKLIICDEPVSALDVSVQSQILNLLKDLQRDSDLTFLFIAHDLPLVEFFCDFVSVMYLGRIVEYAPAKQLYTNPLHPYTRQLLSAIPNTEHSLRSRRNQFAGDTPSVLEPQSGCLFHPRCPLADEQCGSKIPSLDEKNDHGEHFVACWKC